MAQSAEPSKLQSHVDFLSKQGYLKPDAAAALDKDLMDAGFQLGQLMELAGLSVAQAGSVLDAYPPSTHPRVFIACGPGNNAARHLQGFGYTPTVYLPKSSAKTEPSPNLFRNLEDTLKLFDIPIVTTFDGCFEGFEVIVDAVFGFSFKPEKGVRDPYKDIIAAFETTKVPILSVDIPSGWDVITGPPTNGLGSKVYPQALISLTAPKICAGEYKGRHYVGGRFIPQSIYKKYNLPVFSYKNGDQIYVQLPPQSNI